MRIAIRSVSLKANLPDFAKAACWRRSFSTVWSVSAPSSVHRQGGSASLSLPSDAQARPVPTTFSRRADTNSDVVLGKNRREAKHLIDA